MKQGKHYTTVILWILLIAIAAYFGYSVVTSIHQPLTTATVMEYEAGSGYYAAGFVVRDETVIESEYGITVLTAKEGARVAAGEPVATGYLTGDAQDRQSRITELTSQLEQLNYAYRSSSSIADQAALDLEIVSDLTAFSRYVSRRDMNSIADLSPELKGLVLRRSSDESATTVIAAQITATQNELESLRSEAEQDTRTVAAPSAGYFSGTVDGYESVLTPKRLDSLSVQDYNTLEPETIPEHTAGKLISGNTWYYVTAVPSGELGELAKGDRVKVTFARDFYDEIEMTVSRISENQAGFRYSPATGICRMSRSCGSSRQTSSLSPTQDCACRNPLSMWIKTASRASMCSRARPPSGSPSRSCTTTERAMWSSWTGRPPRTSGRATR